MKKSLLAVLFLSLCLTAHAAEDFSGWFVGADVGLSLDASRTEADYTYTNLFGGGADLFTNASQETENEGPSELVSDLNVAYNHPLNGPWYLGVGGEIFLESARDIKSDSYTIFNASGRTDIPRAYQVKTDIESEGHFAVSMEPGYAFNENTLGYLRVAYHFLNANVKMDQLLDASGMNSDTIYQNVSKGKIFHGIGLGAGVKHRLSGNWFLDLSGEWVLFGEETFVGPSFLGPGDEARMDQQVGVTPSWVDLKAGVSYQF